VTDLRPAQVRFRNVTFTLRIGDILAQVPKAGLMLCFPPNFTPTMTLYDVVR